jgi:uncharacterized repeat protein (TIGR03803 family)
MANPHTSRPSSVSNWQNFAAVALAAIFTTVFLAPHSARAQTETVLYSFKGGPSDGRWPYAGVIRDKAGNLYGTTWYGGVRNKGTVFKLTKSGERLVHSFGGSPDGDTPLAGLIRDAAGNIYGTTTAGGTYGLGTIFQLNSGGKETLSHSFAGAPTDGWYPLATLIADTSGNLYGTTISGGASNLGTVFELDAAGNETVLYSFTAVNGDGQSPNGGLVRDSQGNLYGTTVYGGLSTFGTVFKLDVNGKETVLYSFAGGTDGTIPEGSMVMDPAGNLYGATADGGIAGAGTIFKVDPTGKETVLYTFEHPGDAAYPQGGLIRDKAGNLYGTATAGGKNDFGAVFKFNIKTNVETILHSFGATGDGQVPNGPLAIDDHGNIYGATEQGGTSGFGTVFKIAP